MDTAHYLNVFKQGLGLVDQTPFQQHAAGLKVGVWLNSVVLKIQGENWLPAGAEQFSKGIFFSIWINDETLRQGRVYYNIHALKVRDIKGYNIQSREFAAAFRREFKPYEKAWPNVSTQFGPLTLMQGWLTVNDTALANDVATLARSFFPIAQIISKLLTERKK